MGKQVEIPVVRLNDGRDMPMFGLGCSGYGKEPGPGFADVVYEAVCIGYRLFDTAWLYTTEPLVGAGVKRAISEDIVRREDVFIVSKVWATDLRHDDLIAQAKESNQRLGLQYIDLLLINCPIPLKKTGKENWFGEPLNADDSISYDRELDVHRESWSAMQHLVQTDGIVKSIGVANYDTNQLAKTLAHASIKPAVVQTECTPILQQGPLKDLCRQHGIVLMAHTPLGGKAAAPTTHAYWKEFQRNNYENRPRLWDANGVIAAIAKKHGKTIAQVLLKFHVERDGSAVVAKTTRKERLLENARLFDWQLDQQDRHALSAMDTGSHCIAQYFVDMNRERVK